LAFFRAPPRCGLLLGGFLAGLPDSLLCGLLLYGSLGRGVPAAFLTFLLAFVLSGALPAVSAIAHAASVVDCLIWSIIALATEQYGPAPTSQGIRQTQAGQDSAGSAGEAVRPCRAAADGNARGRRRRLRIDAAPKLRTRLAGHAGPALPDERCHASGSSGGGDGGSHGGSSYFSSSGDSSGRSASAGASESASGGVTRGGFGSFGHGFGGSGGE
jgi:uncharacterized membrane protein YgcG